MQSVVIRILTGEDREKTTGSPRLPMRDESIGVEFAVERMFRKRLIRDVNECSTEV